jgi:hypothetical protein
MTKELAPRWILEELEALRATMRMLDKRLKAKEDECFRLKCLIEKRIPNPVFAVSSATPPEDHL